MSKQVPEAANGQDAEYVYLRDRLAGNQAFRRRRGILGGDLLSHHLSCLLQSSSSPEAVKRSAGELFDDVQALVVLAKQLERDGHPHAQRMLLEILEHGGIIPGEEFPVSEMEDVTFVMLDPERTVPMLLFILEGQFEALDAYARAKEKGEWNQELFEQAAPFSPDELTRLCELFPSLTNLSSERWLQHFCRGASTPIHAGDDLHALLTMRKMEQVIFDAGELASKSGLGLDIPPREFTSPGSEILTAMAIEVYRPVQESLAAMRKDERFLCTLQPLETQYSMPKIKNLLMIRFQSFLKCLEHLPCVGFGTFLFRGDQKDVLSFFPREQQSKVLTLHFHVPRLLLEQKIHSRLVGIHPEAEHERWHRHRHGTLVSQNLSQRVESSDVRLGGFFCHESLGPDLQVAYHELFLIPYSREDREKRPYDRKRRIQRGTMPRIMFRAPEKDE